MALRIAQLAFDRILQDAEEKVLGFVPPTSGILYCSNPQQLTLLLRSYAMGDGHARLLRSFFQRDVAPLIPQTAYFTHDQQVEIAEEVRVILRNHCW